MCRNTATAEGAEATGPFVIEVRKTAAGSAKGDTMVGKEAAEQ